MVVAIRKCSRPQTPNSRISGGAWPPPAPMAGIDSTMLTIMSSAANWPSSLFESPSASAESTSRSTMRKRNLR